MYVYNTHAHIVTLNRIHRIKTAIYWGVKSCFVYLKEISLDN